MIAAFCLRNPRGDLPEYITSISNSQFSKLLAFPFIQIDFVRQCPCKPHLYSSFLSNLVPSCPILFFPVQSCSFMSNLVPSCPILFLSVQYCSFLFNTGPSCPILFLPVQFCSFLSDLVPSCLILFLPVQSCSFLSNFFPSCLNLLTYPTHFPNLSQPIRSCPFLPQPFLSHSILS